ncbi:type I restriction modification DNA specificity domain protein [Escherichia coli BCE002_MS12]|nr:type I restriction modification DNA specificity domain protein [Escherichia coli BCE002_MS12]EMX90688.1 type I restriction modification DNA specificity domain protein [Escherichia coli BCE001_MS16]
MPSNLLEANLTQGTARISVSGDQCNEFYHQQFAMDKLRNYINSLSKGSTFKEISLEELRKVKVLCAPLPEQKKIAQILSTWDKAITVTEKLLVNSQQQKKALMQQLLTGKKRLLDENGLRFSREWQKGSLSVFCNIVKGKALSASELVSGHYPVIAGGKSSPYSHFNYTHENVVTVSASGAYAGYVSYHKCKIWASDCSVISAKEGNLIQYFYQLLLSMQDKIYSLQSGGAQPHIYPKDLDSISILVPDVNEQQKIAAVLSAADAEITTLEKKLACLKEEKKALMQQLLTGKRRVKVEVEDTVCA